MQAFFHLELPSVRAHQVARRTGRKTLFLHKNFQKYQKFPKFLEIWAGASSLSVMVGQGLPQPISRVNHALFSTFAFLMPSLGLPLNSLFVPCKHDCVPNNGFHVPEHVLILVCFRQ